jgi:ribonuclease HI
MSKSKPKFYVVWKGRKTGIFDKWDLCQQQISGFEGALYKSFETRAAAEIAFSKSPWDFVGKTKGEPVQMFSSGTGVKKQIIKDSIAVDGAWNTMTLECEYRGVFVKTGQEIFKRGPFKDGTNNIMEFLAIVHALGYCKQHHIALPIYSDSMTALAWVRNKKAKTKVEATPANAPLLDLLGRAENWLKENSYSNELLKWETTLWGENPADFGRK